MHETALVNDLLRAITSTAQEQGGRKVVSVTIRVSPLAPISAEHMRRQLRWAARGTLAEDVRIHIDYLLPQQEPEVGAGASVMLECVELADT